MGKSQAISATTTRIAKQRTKKANAAFVVWALIMSLVVQTGFGVGLPEAAAGTAPPITIDGDPCGTGDWQDPNADTTVVVQNDMNSTATSETVDAGYDCNTLQTINCDNNAADDIFEQSGNASKFADTPRPRDVAIQSAPQGNDICQSYFAASVDGDGDFWMCVASNTLSDGGSGSIWFEFNEVDDALNAGDFALRLSKSGQTTEIAVFVYDGSSWNEQSLVADSFYAAIQSPDEFFGEACVNLSANGLIEDGTCLTAGIGSAYTATGNALSAQLKDSGGTAELGFSNCGLLKVEKQTIPDNGTGSFSYSVSPALGTEASGGDYTLVNDNDSETWINVLEDTYTVTEDTPASPWATKSVVCDNNDGTAQNAVVSANSTTTCVITNHRLPTITVVKQTDPDGAAGDFGFDVDGDTVADHTIADGESFVLTPTTSGLVTITELANDDFDVSAIDCGGVGTNSDPLKSVAIDANYGDADITCTFTNKLSKGTLTLQKVVEAGADPTPLAASTVTLEAGDAGGATVLSGSSGVSGDVDPGTYSLSETLSDSDYLLTSITCDGTDVSDLDNPQVLVDAGDDITCVFTNTFQADPSVTISKSADPTSITGPDTIVYTVTVTNTGNIAVGESLSDVLEADDVVVPGAVTLVYDSGTGADDGTWAVGEVSTYTGSFEVTQVMLDAGETSWANTACVTDSNGDPVDVDGDGVDECDSATTTFTPDPDAVVAKVVDSASVDSTGTLNYDVTFTNTGNISLTPDLTDTFSNGDLTLAGPFDVVGDPIAAATAAPGVTWYYTAAYTVTQDDLDNGGSIDNQVCIGDVDNNGIDDADECDEVTTEIVQLPDAVVAKVVDSASVDSTGTLNYDVTFTNTGNISLTPDLTDTFSNGDLTLAGPFDVVGDPIAAATAAPGVTWYYTAAYTVTQDDLDNGGSIDNQVCIGDVDNNGIDDADECDEVTTEIVQLPDAVVAKVVDSASVDSTGTLNYDVTFTNTGNISLTPDLTDTFSNGDLTLAGPFDVVGDPIAAATAAPGVTWYYTAAYTVTQDDLDNGGSIDNQVCIGDVDNNGIDDADECDEVTTEIVQLPDAVVAKVVDSASVDSTGTLNYDVTFTNTGNISLTPDLTDTFSNGDLTLAGPFDVVGDPIAAATAAPGVTWYYTAAYTVTQDDLDNGGSIDNQVCIGDVDNNGIDDADECDEVTTEIVQLPAHLFVKTFTPDVVDVGDTSSFTLVYTNDGNVTLSAIDITDDVSSLLAVQHVASDDATCTDDDSNLQTITCSVGSLAPGESATVTVTYVAVPLLDELLPPNGETSGANYVFYFENGYVLYGSTNGGEPTLLDSNGVEVADGWSVEGRNQDIVFNAPDGDSFQLHLSCSEVFIDGYGTTGPTLEDNPLWKIDAYEVDRFNVNGLFKECGQIFAPFAVTNTASAEAVAAGGTLTPNPIVASDDLTINNPAPIEVSRSRVRRGDVEIQFFNTDFELDLTLNMIRIEWADGSELEAASYQGGGAIDIGDGTTPVQAPTDIVMDSRSRDWLRLSFPCNCAPEGLTVTIVASNGSTFTFEYPQ